MSDTTMYPAGAHARIAAVRTWSPTFPDAPLIVDQPGELLGRAVAVGSWHGAYVDDSGDEPVAVMVTHYGIRVGRMGQTDLFDLFVPLGRHQARELALQLLDMTSGEEGWR